MALWEKSKVCYAYLNQGYSITINTTKLKRNKQKIIWITYTGRKLESFPRGLQKKIGKLQSSRV